MADEKIVAITYPREEHVEIQKVKNLAPFFVIKTSAGFFHRLWYLISNPFYYLLKGKIRY